VQKRNVTYETAKAAFFWQSIEKTIQFLLGEHLLNMFDPYPYSALLNNY
jgi:hypothetical protein